MSQTKTDLMPAVIDPNSLPVVRSGDDLHAMVHERFTPDKYNVLVPEAMSFTPGIKVAIQRLKLDSNINPDTGRSKDFWSIGKSASEFNLTSNAIRKISGAANIEWNSKECGVIAEAYDDKGRVLRLRYKAVCSARMSTGAVKIGIGTYEYNYNQDSDDPRFKEYTWEKQGGRNVKVYTGVLKTDQINQRRQFALQLVESGAKNRAIFDALGILEKSFSREDISKPFIIPCAIPDIDYDDPSVKKMLAFSSINAQRDVYGDPRTGAIDAEFTIQNGNGNKVDTGTGEVLDPPAQPSQEIPTELPTLPDEKPATAKKLSPAEMRAEFHDKWEASSQKERGEKIERMLDQVPGMRQYVTDKKFAKADTWNQETQMKFIMDLGVKAKEIPAPEAK